MSHVSTLLTEPEASPLSAYLGQLVALRRDLHAHPELKFEEHRTADRVAAYLTALGVPIHRGLGGTGIVATIAGKGSALGSCSRAIGIRADMDALPIQEMNVFDHRSQSDGRMHACGHDGHTAMLLGAATLLAKRPDGDVDRLADAEPVAGPDGKPLPFDAERRA